MTHPHIDLKRILKIDLVVPVRLPLSTPFLAAARAGAEEDKALRGRAYGWRGVARIPHRLAG